jgi:hypothetical protein
MMMILRKPSTKDIIRKSSQKKELAFIESDEEEQESSGTVKKFKYVESSSDSDSEDGEVEELGSPLKRLSVKEPDLATLRNSVRMNLRRITVRSSTARISALPFRGSTLSNTLS